MAKIAHELLAGHRQRKLWILYRTMTVPKMIPDVMPTRIPNPLVNGSSGIVVGMANIPPHNLVKLPTAASAYIDDEDISIEGLMEHIPGRTSRLRRLSTAAGILDAYRTGRQIISVPAPKWNG